MRASVVILLLLGATLVARPAAGYDAEDPANCNGVGWDDDHPLVVSKVTASPRINFVKSPYDDDFKAESCPAATDACRKKSYLVTGDLVLTGATRGSFTCVSYQATQKTKHIWTTGWLPSTALAPVTPIAARNMSDWTGNWEQPHGGIEIKPGGLGGRLQIEGEMVVPTARDFHTGVISAQVMPRDGSIIFLDDGWLPFETKCDSGCRVRMQRIGPFLLVEDNGGCGGAGVTFTGLYHRK
jgi:hypothetical protein